MKVYPSKELCLRMAEYHCETTKNEKMMWDWLFCWGFYEMYMEEWFWWGIKCQTRCAKSVAKTEPTTT